MSASVRTPATQHLDSTLTVIDPALKTPRNTLPFWHRACAVRTAARSHERDDDLTYSVIEARRAAVHAREDLSAVVSLLADANGQLASLRRWVMVVAALLAWLVLR